MIGCKRSIFERPSRSQTSTGKGFSSNLMLVFKILICWLVSFAHKSIRFLFTLGVQCIFAIRVILVLDRDGEQKLNSGNISSPA